MIESIGIFAIVSFIYSCSVPLANLTRSVIIGELCMLVFLEVNQNGIGVTNMMFLLMLVVNLTCDINNIVIGSIDNIIFVFGCGCSQDGCNSWFCSEMYNI